MITNREHGFHEMQTFRSVTIIRDSGARDHHGSCVKCVAQEVQEVTAAVPHFARQQGRKTTSRWLSDRTDGAAAAPKCLSAHLSSRN